MSKVSSSKVNLARAFAFDICCNFVVLVSLAYLLPFKLSLADPGIQLSGLVLGWGVILLVAAAISVMLLYFWASKANGQITLGQSLYQAARQSSRQNQNMPSFKRLPWWRTIMGVQAILLFVTSVAISVLVTQVSLLKLLDAEPMEHAARLLFEMFKLDFKLMPEALGKLIETVYIAFLATLLALPGAFVLSFFCAHNVLKLFPGIQPIYVALRFILNLMRSIEPILWAILFSVWVGFGPFAGMLALMIHSLASLTKQFAEQVESVAVGPIEGIQATGANDLQVVWYGIVPQVLMPHLANSIYRWDINVRMATIIGFVGGGGIGTMLLEYQGQARWPQVGTIIALIALVVWIMDSLSSRIRASII